MKKILITLIFIVITLASFGNGLAMTNSDVEATISHDCGNQDGAINVIVNSANGPFDWIWYSLQNGSIVPIDNDNADYLDNLGAGTYYLNISDAFCAEVSLEFVIEDRSIQADFDITRTCNYLSNGSISLSVTNGIRPYKIELIDATSNSIIQSIDESEGFEDFTNLPIGEYTVSIENEDCGITLFNHTISETEISPTATIDNTCQEDGAIDIQLPISRIEYTYEWEDGSTSSKIENLEMGNYLLTITNDKGCPKVFSYTVEPYNDFNIVRDLSISSLNRHSCEGGNGVVTIIMESSFGYNSDDYPEDQIVWSNGSTGRRIIASPGSYSVTVTDIWGCEKTETFVIKDLDFEVSEVSRDLAIDCQNPLGGINIQTSPPGNYTYLWSNGSIDQNLANVPPGIYSVDVTFLDDLGDQCTKTFSFDELKEPCCDNDLTLDVIVNNGVEGPAVENFSTGEVKILVSGGSGNFNINCINTATNEELTFNTDFVSSNVLSGEYLVTIVDNLSGCTVEEIFVVNNEDCSSEDLSKFSTVLLDRCNYIYLPDPGVSCDGSPKNLKVYYTAFHPIEIYFPIRITLEGPDNYFEEILIESQQELDAIKDPETTNIQFCISRSPNPYIYTVEDACSNIYSKEIETCHTCHTYAVNDVNEGFHDYYLDKDDIGHCTDCFKLQVYKPCEYDDKWSRQTGITVRGKPKLGMGYKITWPNGNIYEISIDFNGNSIGKKGSREWRPTKAQFDNGGPYYVTVERTDGACSSFSIPILFGNTISNVLFESYIFSGHISNTLCKQFCNSNRDVFTHYVEDECKAGSNRDSDETIFFNYYPFDYDNPCGGGGEFRANIIVDGEVSIEKMTVTPGTSFEEVEYIDFFNNPQKIFFSGNLSALKRGACLFDSYPIFNEYFGKDILLNWVQASDDPTRPEYPGDRTCDIWEVDFSANFVDIYTVPQYGGYYDIRIRDESGHDYTEDFYMGGGSRNHIRFNTGNFIGDITVEFLSDNLCDGEDPVKVDPDDGFCTGGTVEIVEFNECWSKAVCIETGANIETIIGNNFCKIQDEDGNCEVHRFCEIDGCKGEFAFEIDCNEINDATGEVFPDCPCEFNIAPPNPPSSNVECTDVIVDNRFDSSTTSFLNVRMNDDSNITSVTAISEYDNLETDKIIQFKIENGYKPIQIEGTAESNIILAVDATGNSKIYSIDLFTQEIDSVQLNNIRISKVERFLNGEVHFSGSDINRNSIEGSLIEGVITINTIDQKTILNNFFVNETHYLLLHDGTGLQLAENSAANIVASWVFSEDISSITDSKMLTNTNVLVLTSSNLLVSFNIGSQVGHTFEYPSTNFNIMGVEEGSDFQPLVYGDFTETFEINDELYTSNGAADIFFILHEPSLEVLSVAIEGQANNESITGLATDLEYNKMAYFGHFEASTILSNINFITDSICEYIVVVDLPKCDTCLTTECIECTDCNLCPQCPDCNMFCDTCSDCTLCPDCPQCDECADCIDCTLCPQCTDCDVDCTTCTDCNLCPNCPDCDVICDNCTDCSLCPWCLDCDPNNCPQMIGFEIDMSPGNGVADITLHMPINSIINVTLYELTSLGWAYVSSDNFGPSGPGVTDISFGIDGLHDKDLKFVFDCVSCPDCPPIEHEFDTRPDTRSRAKKDQNDNFGVNVFPNPTQHFFTLDFTCNYDEYGEIFVLSSAGKKLVRDEVYLAKGRNRYIIQGSDYWSEGVYYFVFKSNKRFLTERIIKIN